MPASNKEPKKLSADVTIVGAGPAGLVLANLLAAEGLKIVLIEERDELISYPRGVGMDDETMRVLQSTGLIESILPHTVPNQRLIYLGAGGRVLGGFAPTEEPFGWPRKFGFIQPLIDAALLKGLERFENVSVHWGQRAQELNQDARSVLCRTEGTEGSQLEVESAYLIGCDGGRSWTRKACGIAFDGVSETTRWLVVDIENDPVGTPNAYIVCDPNRPHVSIGLPHGVRRFEFMLFEHESDETAENELAMRLVSEHVRKHERSRIIRRRVYIHHARLAERFVSGRVMIAGDAAHLMPVWQGQGYNSGVRDVGNLAWKLAMVVKGIAGPKLLDTYETERRAHAKSMVDLSRLTGHFLGITNPALAGARDLVTRAASIVPPFRDYFLQMRFKPMPTYKQGAVVDRPEDKKSPAGQLFIQPQVVLPGETSSRKLDDVIGNRFSVLRWGADPREALSGEELEPWRRLNARFVSVLPMIQLEWAAHQTGDDNEIILIGDLDGRLRDWFDRHPYPFIFLRPDRIIGGACQVQDAGEASRRLADILGIDRVTAL